MNSKNTSNLSSQSAAVLTPEQPAVSTRSRRRGKELLRYLLLRPEAVPLVMLVLAFIGGSLLSP